MSLSVAALRITARFLQPYSHGRGEDGMPEWPPSPLRLFQAMVASAVGRHPNEDWRARAKDSLRWLERLPPPEIIAPPARPTTPYRLFVPDNVGDKVAKSWSAGRPGAIADYRTEKDARPLRLEGEAVHYVFQCGADVVDHLSILERASRSMTHLGWGIDMVAGDAGMATDQLEGERWIPQRRGGRRLRLPVAGTLEDLDRKHQQFLSRLDGMTFRPVPPLTRFETVPYARATDPVAKPFAAFRLLHPASGRRLWLDPQTRARDVAAWMRHAVGEVAQHWPFGSTGMVVHGHREAVARTQSARFSFLPLPTINPTFSRVEGIGRVLLSAPPGYEGHVEWLQARLAGHDLVWQGTTVAFLDPLLTSDWVVRQYIEPSTRWSTVTPVVLPGHDDRSERKGRRLLERALLQAGIDPVMVQGLDWRKVGFRAGTELASRYLPPDKVSGPLFHVRLQFTAPVVGPLSIGSGRYRGMGVFARE